MWQKLILAAAALAGAAADGAAKPAFLQACEDAGDAGCAAKLRRRPPPRATPRTLPPKHFGTFILPYYLPAVPRGRPSPGAVGT